MGFAQGEIVLEVGYDTDCDDALRDEIAATVGTKFLEGSATEVVDAVILWWRDGDRLRSLPDFYAERIAEISGASVITLGRIAHPDGAHGP